MIKGTEKNYFELLEKKYSKYVVIGQKSFLEMEKHCKGLFKIKDVTLEKIDFCAKLLLDNFMDLSKDVSSIKIYYVPFRENTEIYYDDYWSSFEGEFPVYIFADIEKNRWCACGSLLESFLRIQKGILKEDVENKTREYFLHLQEIYLFEKYMKAEQKRKQGIFYFFYFKKKLNLDYSLRSRESG